MGIVKPTPIWDGLRCGGISREGVDRLIGTSEHRVIGGIAGNERQVGPESQVSDRDPSLLLGTSRSLTGLLGPFCLGLLEFFGQVGFLEVFQVLENALVFGAVGQAVVGQKSDELGALLG